MDTKTKSKKEPIRLSRADFEQVVSNVAKTAIEARVKELGLDKVDIKNAMFPAHFAGKTEEEIAKMEKKERAATFIKAVFRKDMATLASLKVLSEGTGSEGGFQVPEEFAAEINRIAEDFGLVRRFARRLPMGSDTLNVPRLASSVTVTVPGENVAGTESDPVWANVQLLAKTVVGLTVSSNELLADANISVVELLAELFAEALAGFEDEQGLTGTGSPFTGILGDAGVSVQTMAATNTAFTDVTLDDLRDQISLLKPLALNGASFTMHREIWSIVQKLKDADSAYHISAANPVLLPGSLGGAPGGVVVGSIWGYPVWLSEKMPKLSDSAISTKFIAFGNYNHLWFGDRQQMTLDISNSATVGANKTFEQNQSAVRVTERIAIAVGLPDGFSVLRTAAA